MFYRNHHRPTDPGVLTIPSLQEAYRAGRLTPADTVRDTFARIADYADPALFITLRSEGDVAAEAAILAAQGSHDLPLYGIPVAIKDNINVAGIPTTAACPAFAYMPDRDATVVARLRAAGALVIGKTNLDQFATGLVGTRSPYGVPRNPVAADLLPGGSSSGSAAAVAAGIVPIALGTDTAGSGRVPAMLNNIVGMKPSLGLVSTAGVVPACRTLDCVSVFALTVEDAWTVLAALAGPDAADSFSRPVPLGAFGPAPPVTRIGVLAEGQREFFGDVVAAAAYARSLERLVGLGASLVEIDFAPFAEAARLLYEGPWVAERWTVVEALARRDPEALHPVTRVIIEKGRDIAAADAFRALYRLQDLRAAVAPVFAGLDALVLPTAPTVYSLAEVEADNVRLNSRLGTYTNFVNLLDLAAIAVPAALVGGRPYGVTFIAPSGHDAALASLARAFVATDQLPVGATGIVPRSRPFAASRDGRIEVAVFGAHMSGLPLNGDLRALGASFVRDVKTAPHYRFYLLPGGPPRRPGLLRVAEGGPAIAAEVWSLTPEGFGKLVAAVPSPLGFGTVALADGTEVKGFLVEAAAVAEAHDISQHGGWRAFLASEAAALQTAPA
jgi:allophanate hydrolase